MDRTDTKNQIAAAIREAAGLTEDEARSAVEYLLPMADGSDPAAPPAEAEPQVIKAAHALMRSGEAIDALEAWNHVVSYEGMSVRLVRPWLAKGTP